MAAIRRDYPGKYPGSARRLKRDEDSKAGPGDGNAECLVDRSLALVGLGP